MTCDIAVVVVRQSDRIAPHEPFNSARKQTPVMEWQSCTSAQLYSRNCDEVRAWALGFWESVEFVVAMVAISQFAHVYK